MVIVVVGEGGVKKRSVVLVLRQKI